MAFDGIKMMTDEDYLAHEAKIKAALHKTEAALKLTHVAVAGLHGLLAALRQDVANDRGMDVTVMSGGDDKPDDPPPKP